MNTSSDIILYKKKWFNGQEYIKKQREKIVQEAWNYKNGKLYIEINWKFLYDAHCARVLPWYIVDSQKHIFAPLKEQIEIIFCVDANEIVIDKEWIIKTTNTIIKRTEIEIWIKPHIVINNIDIQQDFDKILEFEQEFQRRNYRVWERYKFIWYPFNTKIILGDNGFGNDDHIPLNKNIIIVLGLENTHTNKTSVCLGQIYNDKQIGIESWYTIFNPFPISELQEDHPINLAYQATIENNEITEKNNEDKKNTKELLQKITKKETVINISEIFPHIVNDEIICIAWYQEIKRRREQNNNIDNLITRCETFINEKGYNINLKID